MIHVEKFNLLLQLCVFFKNTLQGRIRLGLILSIWKASILYEA